MKQIKILLPSALTFLLITGNNTSYAAPHYTDFSGRFQDKKSNMHSGGRVMPKPNRLGDDISGYGYKNILKKGNVFKGNVRISPNRGSYTDSGRITYKPDKDGFIVQTGGGIVGSKGQCLGIECKVPPTFDPISKYSISDELAFVPKPDGALGPDVVTTLEHGPGIASQPKGVLLKFINGEWVDP